MKTNQTRVKNGILSVFLAAVMLAVCALPLMNTVAYASERWVTSWATSIVDGHINVDALNLKVSDVIAAHSTVRIELSVTTAGKSMRMRFSNEYGDKPLKIEDVTVAKSRGDGTAKIYADTVMPVTFGGAGSVTIPKGQTLWSDDIAFETAALDRICVSMYFSDRYNITSAGLSNGRTFMNIGGMFSKSKTSAESIPNAAEVNITSSTVTYHTIPFLAEIQSDSPYADACAAVFIGDSTLVNDAYLHYAERISAAGYKNISVINEAVIGNKLLSDGSGLIGNLYGDAMLDRFERDALGIAGVKYIFVKIGLNDIAHQYSKSLGPDTPKHSAGDIIDGYRTLIRRAHAKGIKIYFFTKSPWKGYERAFLGKSGDLTWQPEIQAICDELNAWITTNNEADGYIDCSPLANPADPNALCPSFTPDWAHLTNLGSIALADLIPLGFVGISTSKTVSSAAINGVDPYREKNRIIAEMESADKKGNKNRGANEPAEEPSTRQTEPSTNRTEPSTSRTEPSTKQTEPSTSRTEPSTKQTEPSTNRTEPPSEKNGQSANQTGQPESQSEAASAQSAPSEPAAAPDDTAAAAEEPAADGIAPETPSEAAEGQPEILYIAAAPAENTAAAPAAAAASSSVPAEPPAEMQSNGKILPMMIILGVVICAGVVVIAKTGRCRDDDRNE